MQNFYFDSTSQTCAGCPTGTGYLQDTGDNSVCTCNGNGNFVWNQQQLKCVCKATFFLDGAACVGCPSGTGVDTDTTDDGACTCKEGNFKWDSTQKNCFCDAGFFLEGSVCSSCPTTPTFAIAPDSSIDSACSCKES
jgi:hypothetical protein